MENIEIIYGEYKRLIERHDQLLDSSFNDFKLYGILGPVLIGASTLVEGLFNSRSDNLFIILLLIEFLIAIIAFRDLLKQIYINQLGFNIGKYEIFLRDKLLQDIDKSKYEIFCLRKSWIEKYFSLTRVSYKGFLMVLFITITSIPFLILWGFNYHGYAKILTLITFLLFSLYAFLAYSIFKKSNNYED
jgi:hypothetical protein